MRHKSKLLYNVVTAVAVVVAVVAAFVAGGCGRSDHAGYARRVRLAQGRNVDSVLNVLDSELEKSEGYVAEREGRIRTLRGSLASAKNPSIRFDLARDIYEEYRTYQYDSSRTYALRMLEMAVTPEDSSLAHTALMDVFVTAGFYKEASEECALVDSATLSVPDRMTFLSTLARYYGQLASYTDADTVLSNIYRGLKRDIGNEILHLAEPGSYEYEDARLDASDDPMTIYGGRTHLLDTKNLTLHQQAINHSVAGTNALILGDTLEAVWQYAMSALADVRTSTHETTAAKDLAGRMQASGDHERADRYIRHALADAQRFHSNLRIIEIGTILPVIEQTRYNRVDSQRTQLAVTVAVTLLLLALILLLFLKLRKRTGLLADSNRKISEQSDALRTAYDQLSAVNASLKESEEIKDRYIVETLIGNRNNQEFVTLVERTSKKAVIKLKAGKYDEAQQLLAQMGVRRERERMFDVFDAAFLKLFPNFIDEFNKLFPPEHRIALGSECELPTDVRIYALMRLGVENPAEVADYLSLSVNTVYVYKTRLKSRALVDKQDFDAAIMAIPKP